MHHHCLDLAGARYHLSGCTLGRTHLFLSAPTYLLERPMRWRWAVPPNAGRRASSESGRCLRTGCQYRFSRTGWRAWGTEGGGTGVRPGAGIRHAEAEQDDAVANACNLVPRG